MRFDKEKKLFDERRDAHLLKSFRSSQEKSERPWDVTLLTRLLVPMVRGEEIRAIHALRDVRNRLQHAHGRLTTNQFDGDFETG